MNRRTASFVAAAAVCFLLVPLAARYAWVCAGVGSVYVGLALVSWLDARGHRRL